MTNGTEIDVSKTEAPASTEIATREQDVVRADLAFSASLHNASEAGKEVVERATSLVRPLLIGVGLLAGTLLAVQLLRGSQSTRGLRARPFWSELARTATIALASAAGRRLAERWIDRHYDHEVISLGRADLVAEPSRGR